MRHTATVERIKDIVLADSANANDELEAVIDEVFEKGYQAGYHDRQEFVL
jgi:hypothetical protein